MRQTMRKLSRKRKSPLCKGDCQPKADWGVVLGSPSIWRKRESFAYNPSGPSGRLPLHKGGFAALLVALLLILLCACTGQEIAADRLELWFAATDSDGKYAGLSTETYSGEATVPAVMEALLEGPEANSGLISPIPAGTELRSWTRTGNVVRVDLSYAYLKLSGVERILANYCITLTLTQLDGVTGVRITVNGVEVSDRDGRPLRGDDVLFSGAEEEPVELIAALHFRRLGGNELGVEQRIFRLIESESATLAVLQALLAGPQEAGLVALLPSGVEVYSARVESGVCYADFSAALLAQVPPTEEEQRLVLRSVVESLCSLGHVQAVQLLVEGEPLTVYGAVDATELLSLN